MDRPEDEWLLNEADPIQHAAAEYRCAMRILDDWGIPRWDGIGRYSLVGRLQQARRLLRSPGNVEN